MDHKKSVAKRLFELSTGWGGGALDRVWAGDIILICLQFTVSIPMPPQGGFWVMVE